MELLFETKPAGFLREVLCAPISQEETAETIVPDSFPDAERILDAYGSVVLRGKDYRSGGVSVSGGIHAGVLYAPEDGTPPRSLHVYIPFTIKLEGDLLSENTRVCADCRVRSVDARIMNSRKVMVRVNLCGTVTGYEPATQELCSYVPSEDADLQVRASVYPVIRARETAEKGFTMTEEAELPAGRAPMKELCKYLASLEVVDAKMVGSKAVFKGNVLLKLLYLTEDDELVSWTCQLPFSQYVEMEQEYDDDEELETAIALTDLSVEDANGQGRRLLINLQLLAQCTVIGRDSLEVLEDAYSLYHDFTPQWKRLEASGRLDRQNFTETVRTAVQAPVKSILDVQVYLDDPAVRQEGEQVIVTLPMTASVLYLDENDEVQGVTARMESACRTEIAETCFCRPTARLSGEAFAVPSGDGLEIRCTVVFTLDTMTRQGLETLCGGTLGDERLSSADRPSVILRPADADESLWSLAKRCRTTIEAICAANGLGDESARPAGMLLIPIMK